MYKLFMVGLPSLYMIVVLFLLLFSGSVLIIDYRVPYSSVMGALNLHMCSFSLVGVWWECPHFLFFFCVLSIIASIFLPYNTACMSRHVAPLNKLTPSLSPFVLLRRRKRRERGMSTFLSKDRESIMLGLAK